MKLDSDELDKLICDVVPMHPMFATREDIVESVASHVRAHLETQVLASLNRLIGRNLIEDDRDCSRGRPYTYSHTPVRRI